MAGAPQRVAYTSGERTLEATYRFGRNGVTVRVDGEPLDDVVLLAANPTSVDLQVGGVRRTIAVHRIGDVSYVDSPLGSTALAVVPRFADPSAVQHAGSLLAPMPGAVVRVLAEPGAAVTAGQPLVVLEAMKMEHTVAAPADGTVADVRVAPGDQVDTGQVLAVVDGLTDVEQGHAGTGAGPGEGR